MKISLKVVNFEEELRRIEQEVLRQGKLEVNERIDYATQQLKIVTPVDTGEAREGWKNHKSKLNFKDAGTISNEVEHIVHLNQGHSQQAPTYFIEQVLSTIGIISPN